jgi:predicted O-linked N-acetylglucosamine transferase (SPINDLY family)
LVFAGWVNDPAEHLARYRLADLFLDTLPFNAHTTASDALWAGLPVLTCQGHSYAARVSASLLTAMDCRQLIAQSLSEYEALAVEVAQTPTLAASLRSRVSARRLTTPLFETGRYCRDLESLYLQMWQRHQRGAPPEHLDVTASGRDS